MEFRVLSSIARSVRRLPSQLVRDRLTVLCLLGVFAAVCALRVQFLLGQTYPPGGDDAEQLYQAHLWLGTAFPNSPNSFLQVPPLYPFLFFLPLTSWASFLTGAKWLTGVAPALLVFPSYWFLRQVGVGRSIALFGGAMVALASQYSAMVAWNAGATAVGIFFAIFYFGALTRALQTGHRREIALAALFFGLVAGTHFFTFLFVVVASIFSAGLVLILIPGRRRSLRTLAYVAFGGVLASVVFVPIYYTLLLDTTNVGFGTAPLPPDFWSRVVPFAWGYNQPWITPLSTVDVGVSIVASVVVLAVHLRTPVTSVLLGSIASAILLAFLYPGSYTLGLLYLPFILILIVAIFSHLVYSRRDEIVAWTRRRTRRAAGNATSGTRVPVVEDVHSARRRYAKVAPAAVAAAIMVSFLTVNASYSYSTFQHNVEYYTVLNGPSDIDVLNWLEDSTPANARVLLSSASIATWVLGYSNRYAYSPQPLRNVVTSYSYGAAYDSNLALAGRYVTGDPFITVGENLPAGEGDPAVYLPTSLGWSMLTNAEVNATQFEVVEKGKTTQVNLQHAVVASVNLSTSGDLAATQNLTLSWPGTKVVLNQSVMVAGQAYSIAWRAVSGTLVSVRTQFEIPPSGYGGLSYESVPRLSAATSVDDQLNLQGSPVSLVILGAGASFNQTQLSTGWTQVTARGSGTLNFSLAGLTGISGNHYYSIDTGSLLEQLGVTYILADFEDGGVGYGYETFLRCKSFQSTGGIEISQAYSSANLYVFSVRY